MVEAQNIVVLNCEGLFDIGFDFKCECGQTHRGREISQRPVRRVAYVKKCCDTQIVFDYKDAKFFDVPAL